MQFCILPDLVSSGKCLHISVSEAELDVVFIMPRSLKVQIIMYFQKNEQIENISIYIFKQMESLSLYYLYQNVQLTNARDNLTPSH